jgi:hypothetical protein
MAKGKELLAEAIAEAKVVREAAIRNATKQLEENLTPSIKEMLAKKLEEDLDLNEGEDEENIDENANSGFKEVKPKSQKVNEADDEDKNADDADADADAADTAADSADAAADDADADADAADAAADDADADAAADDAPADDAADDAADDETPLKDITLGDLKQIISDLVAASAAPAPGTEDNLDMTPGDVQGAGEETPAADAPADPNTAVPADPNADADPASTDDDDDEIDISEILRELEEEEKAAKKVCPKCGKEQCVCKENKANDIMPEDQTGKEHCKPANADNGKDQDQELSELRRENKELREGLEKCTKTLKEVNLLNAKLTVASKLLSKNSLTESQKANIIKTLDGAKSAKEAVALGKTLLEGIKNTRKPITESRRGSASKPAGPSTASKRNPQNDLIDEGMVRRFQQLAGIITE